MSWILIERIATILESGLNRSASVRRNVQLPVLGCPMGRTRQCDIVIRCGSPERQIITIVEVQKRKRKPEIGAFDSWIEKMREVGAHQLICVSQKGFPQSIRSKVMMRHGAIVRLLTLEQIETNATQDRRIGFYDIYYRIKSTSDCRIVLPGRDAVAQVVFPVGEIGSYGGSQRMITTNEIDWNRSQHELFAFKRVGQSATKCFSLSYMIEKLLFSFLPSSHKDGSVRDLIERGKVFVLRLGLPSPPSRNVAYTVKIDDEQCVICHWDIDVNIRIVERFMQWNIYSYIQDGIGSLATLSHAHCGTDYFVGIQEDQKETNFILSDCDVNQRFDFNTNSVAILCSFHKVEDDAFFGCD